MNEHQTLVLSHYFADSSALLPFILSLLGPDQSREVQPLVSTVLLLGCSWVIFISVVFRKPPCLRLRGAAGPSPQTQCPYLQEWPLAQPRPRSRWGRGCVWVGRGGRQRKCILKAYVHLDLKSRRETRSKTNPALHQEKKKKRNLLVWLFERVKKAKTQACQSFWSFLISQKGEFKKKSWYSSPHPKKNLNCAVYWQKSVL